MALILIADASGSERQRLRQIVEQQDHIVVEADSGAYCLEIAEYHQPQCVLLNAEISAAADVELLPALQALKIPTIVLASATQTYQQQQDLNRAATTVLNSPPVELELLSTLGNILNLASIDPAQTEFQAAELEPVNRPQPDQP
ncbi:MAG: response regulator, partial [Cyanothece sp. SIO1E1]|nr:response regulator [Cyanothece sp. SIO1E1]